MINGFDFSAIYEGIDFQDGRRTPYPEINMISNKGIVTVEWSQELYNLTDLEYALENGIIKLELATEYDYYKPEDVLLGFNVTRLEPQRMFLQLNFSDPSLISQFSVSFFLTLGT